MINFNLNYKMRFQIYDSCYYSETTSTSLSTSSDVFPGRYILFCLSNQDFKPYCIQIVGAKYFVLLYGLLELYLQFKNSPTDNVAHLAHLSGMLFAFILLKYWSRQRNSFY